MSATAIFGIVPARRLSIRLSQFVVCCLATVVLACPARSAVFEFPAGRPVGVADWQHGLRELVNSPKRIHGYGMMHEDVHFYSGDTQALNRFLDRYSKLKLPIKHRVVLRAEKGTAASPGWKQQNKDPLPCDWKISITPFHPGKYDAVIEIYLKGNIDRSLLELPTGVEVDDGTPKAR